MGITILGYFVGAFILGSLVEYWVHRWMHAGVLLGDRHTNHHRTGEGQGVMREFFDYVKGSFVVMLVPFLWSWQAGVAWSLGGLVYAAFSAYSHQLQHESPGKCFWMKKPVHYAHHKYGMWDHNFGLAVDWWDHIFGTYRDVDCTLSETEKQAERGYLQLQWW